jgi:hypothetical protein
VRELFKDGETGFANARVLPSRLEHPTREKDGVDLSAPVLGLLRRKLEAALLELDQLV